MVSSNLLINNISKKGKIHVSKQRLYLMTLLSIAMILMLVSIAGGAPFAYITNYGSNNVSVINKATDNIKAMVMYAIFIVILKELQLPWIEQRYM
jgi:YVTN family beta-propeller protein